MSELASPPRLLASYNSKTFLKVGVHSCSVSSTYAACLLARLALVESACLKFSVASLLLILCPSAFSYHFSPPHLPSFLFNANPCKLATFFFDPRLFSSLHHLIPSSLPTHSITPPMNSTLFQEYQLSSFQLIEGRINEPTSIIYNCGTSSEFDL